MDKKNIVKGGDRRKERKRERGGGGGERERERRSMATNRCVSRQNDADRGRRQQGNHVLKFKDMIG